MELFGKEFVEIILMGDIFDDVYKSFVECCEKENCMFIYLFDDLDVMVG